MRPLCGELNTTGPRHCAGSKISNGGSSSLSRRLIASEAPLIISLRSRSLLWVHFHAGAGLPRSELKRSLLGSTLISGSPQIYPHRAYGVAEFSSQDIVQFHDQDHAENPPRRR